MCVHIPLCGVFLYLEFPFLSLLRRDVSYPSRPYSNAARSLKIFCSPFLVELTPPSFLLLRTLLPFYYNIEKFFLLDLGAFLPAPHYLLGQMAYI